jgi:hypothetical protein
MKYAILVTVILMSIWGCSSPTNVNSTNTVVDSSQLFFPVTSFIKGQLKMLDSIPVNLMYVAEKGTQADTSWLNKQQLREKLAPFTQNNIDLNNLTPFFAESKFKDQTITSITFTYQPKQKLPDSIKLQNWDVYVNSETGKIKKIFIVQKDPSGTLLQQLTWQIDQYAIITTLKENEKGEFDRILNEKFVWKFD